MAPVLAGSLGCSAARKALARSRARACPRARRARGAPRPPAESILFGDLHVHSTVSSTAWREPAPAGGDGTHPQADACDFARWCSGLDFFSLTDHAESLTPRIWQDTLASLRDCQARAGETGAPDLLRSPAGSGRRSGAPQPTTTGTAT